MEEKKLSPAKLARGEKWKKAKELIAFKLKRGEATQKEADWFDTQPAIVNDIKYYEDYQAKLEAAKKAGFNSIEEHEADIAKKKEEARHKEEAKFKKGK